MNAERVGLGLGVTLAVVVGVKATVGVSARMAGDVDSLCPPRAGDGAGVLASVGVTSEGGGGVFARASLVGVARSFVLVAVGAKTIGVSGPRFTEPASGAGGKGLRGP